MTYIDRLNEFFRWLESNPLPGNAQLMFLKMLDVFNRAGWPEQVQVDNQRLMIMIEAGAMTTALRARDKLVEAGLLTVCKGKKGSPNRYSLKNDTKSTTKTATVSATENATKSATESATHIKTKTKTKTKTNIPPPYSPPSGGDGGPASPEAGETGEGGSAPEKAKRPKNPDVFAAYAGEDAELLKALRDFEEMRLKIKKPMTDRAKRQLCGRLDALAKDSAGKIRLLDEAVLHCWQSVYPRDGGGKGSGTASPVSSVPGEDAVRREELRQWEELLTYGALREGQEAP